MTDHLDTSPYKPVIMVPKGTTIRLLTCKDFGVVSVRLADGKLRLFRY